MESVCTNILANFLIGYHSLFMGLFALDDYSYEVVSLLWIIKDFYEVVPCFSVDQ